MEIELLRKHGMSLRKIAEEVGCAVNTVRSHLAAEGLPRYKRTAFRAGADCRLSGQSRRGVVALGGGRSDRKTDANQRNTRGRLITASRRWRPDAYDGSGTGSVTQGIGGSEIAARPAKKMCGVFCEGVAVRYARIEDLRQHHPVAVMCRVLEVSESGYHAWRQRPPSARKQENLRLETEIKAAH